MDSRDLCSEGQGMRVWWGSKGAIEPFLDKPADRKVVPLTFVVSNGGSTCDVPVHMCMHAHLHAAYCTC